MSTGYTQKIIDGTVKTPKEFLHLCLINLGICVSTGDMPFDASQGNYTEYIKKSYQDSISYHTKALENAKVNVEYMYAFANGDDASAVLKTRDAELAVKTLEEKGFSVYTKDEAYRTGA